MQGCRPITWVAAWIAATSVSAFAWSEDASGPSDQAAQLQQQIAELEAQLEAAKAKLAEMQAETAGPVANQAPADSKENLPPDESLPIQTPEAEPEASGQAGSDPASIPTERGAFAEWLASWKSRIEIGLNGAEGNSSRQSLRFGFSTDRKSSAIETKLSTNYRLTTQSGVRSENRLEMNGRNDWLQGESPLRYFVQGKVEFDEFQAWDARASGFGGLGYDIIKDDTTTLVGRGGFGGSKRFGSIDDDFRAEAFLAGDITHKLSEAQKLKAGLEYLPDADGWRAYRLNSNASWEMKIDPESELFLRVGVATRYDSDPGSAKTTDVDYFVNLGWAF